MDDKATYHAEIIAALRTIADQIERGECNVSQFESRTISGQSSLRMDQSYAKWLNHDEYQKLTIITRPIREVSDDPHG